MSRRSQAALLLRLDALRITGVARRPSASVWIGVLLPAVLLALGVAAVGRVSGLTLLTTQDGVTLGVLIAGPVAFVTYGVLFRGGDDPFLRRLGIAPGALFRERALRLAGWTLAVVLLCGIAYGAAGSRAARVAAIGIAAGAAAWSGGLLAFAAAARAMAGSRPGRGWGCLTAGMWDREVAAAAPLVYAPLLPLAGGAVSGGVVAGAAETPALLAIAVVLLAAGLAARRAEAAYAAALPRFGPQALEMTFAPEPDAAGAELRARRGVARLLPRAAAAAWARDSAVVARRFAWASRVAWPVVIFAFVALARWGRSPGTRAWVVAAAALVLVLQGAAAIGLGRLERGGARWIDRAAGVAPAQRFVGRWAWGWGISLWLTVPLALSWSWWAAAGPGWPWVAAAAGTSGVAAAVSITAAGRR